MEATRNGMGGKLGGWEDLLYDGLGGGKSVEGLGKNSSSALGPQLPPKRMSVLVDSSGDGSSLEPMNLQQ
jgi:hypothetical protein